MKIRPATAADWPPIWHFFRTIVAAGDSYTYPRDIAEPLARALWMIEPPGQVLVAEDADGAILGSAKVGPNQMGPGGHVATASFMVDAARRRGGVGRALGEAALDWARNRGFEAMQFNAVVSTNTPAVALWRSLGFTIVGTVPDAFALPNGGYADLHIMHRTLDDRASS